jgi:hypothetical protein
MIPLYGFLKGDTMGLLIFGYADETVAQLAQKLVGSARVRVAHKPNVQVIYQGKVLDSTMTLKKAGLEPLDRFDVVEVIH